MLLKIRAGLSDLETIREFVSRSAASIGVQESLVGDLKLAVDEAISNIILYGYQGEAGDIEIELGASESDLIIKIRDHAPVFDTSSYKVRVNEEPFGNKSPGGYGIHLIRSMVDDLEHRVSDNGGNELVLIKRHALE